MDTKKEWPEAIRMVWLTGGLVALNESQSSLVLVQTGANGRQIATVNIPTYPALFAALMYPFGQLQDFTIAIVLSAMAVETAVIQAYLKWKAIEHYDAGGPLNPQGAIVETWEACYRVEARGFESGVKFVGKFLIGKTFNSFVSEKQAAAAQPTGLLTPGTIQKDLFDKRNAAMHRGKMNFSKEDAEKAHAAAIQAVRTVKWMDEDKYQAEEKARRDELYAASQPTV